MKPNRRQRALEFLLAVVLIATAIPAFAGDAELEFFEKKIRPVLVTYCYECHSTESKKVGGELLLDSRDALRAGGDTGPAIRAGHPDESLLIKAIKYTDDSVKMPPKGKLPDSVIADFEAWVKSGADDPRIQATPAKAAIPWPEVMRQRSDWWSLKPIDKPVVPSTQSKTSELSPIDRFIEARLTEKGLSPAATTDPRTFIRRLSLVLTGLPPKIDQVDQFVAECQIGKSSEPLPASAVENLVDSLMQSPHFGEHWARHWMDVVRFSETHGNEWNYEVHHAWRYRDYLIRAFNDDVPYDQFIREHIAGDLLPQPRWNERGQFNESIIGTGFYRFGEVNHDDCISLRSIGYDLADNQIDTLTKAFQATTVACARCHNHKLDAISTDDYYAMLAILRSSRNVSHCIDSPDVNAAKIKRLGELKSELRREIASVWKTEAPDFARYMQAAYATRAKRPVAAELAAGLVPQRLEKWIATLSAEKQPFEEPFEVWRRLSAVETSSVPDSPTDRSHVANPIAQVWQALTVEFEKEVRDRAEFNSSRFEAFADFRSQDATDWMKGGQAMTMPPSKSGDFVVHPDGDSVVQSILPAGRFTHALSSKLNATLRSPVLPTGKKYISFQVLGQRSSAVRLVSNHCQLNYANYRALTSPDLQWVTFSPPDDRESLRTYAELMTMFDNPKFPDQLSPLGGDGANYKVPWDKAAENPRSYFGVTQVVLHDSPETPKTDISPLKALFHGTGIVGAENQRAGVHASNSLSTDEKGIASLPNPRSDETDKGGEGSPSLDLIVDRYALRMAAAIDAWSADQASEDDVRWLDALLRRELLGNQATQSPRLATLMQEYRRVDAELSLPRVIAGVSDGGPGIEQPVFIRGDCARPGEAVPRRYLEVLSMVGGPHSNSDPSKQNAEQSAHTNVITTEVGQAVHPRPFSSSGSGRLELAEQIASPANPLTARVMVNRIWHHLFGTGLVRTVDDFGHVGELPSHPELLDHLSTKFMNEGWSVKRMIRSLVLTHTFQASNRPSPLSREIDPQNRLLQHYSARRMEAESVRDSILAASGGLVVDLYGPSIQPFREKEYADRRLFPGPLDGHGRRGVYIKNNLMEAPKFLGAFNFPGGKVAQGRRDVTNVPAQALALLNDPFVVQQAVVWSNRLVSRSGDSVATRVDEMFRSAFGRSPSAEEQDRFQQLIGELSELDQVPAESVMSSPEIWKDVAHTLFNFNEMIFIP